MDGAPPGSRSCGEQASCLSTILDSTECLYRSISGRKYLYCPLHLTYPREGSRCEITTARASPPPPGRGRGSAAAANGAARATTAAAGTTSSSTGGSTAAGASAASDVVEIEIADSDVQICSGDRLGTVIEGPGGVTVPGGVNQVMWLPSSNYTQWVRWEAADLGPAVITFSLRNGNKACSTNSNPTQVLINGMTATCSNPRYDPDTGAVGGCQSNDGTIFNECLWTIIVPRPGGLGWTGAVCVTDALSPPSPAPRPPPRPGASPNIRAPAAPPDPCVLQGPSSDGGGLSHAISCGTQGSCLDIYYNSANCRYQTVGGDPSGSQQYLLCPICITWPRPGSPCALNALSPMEYVCAGDENSLVIDGETGQRVVGGGNILRGWEEGTRYCQWARWPAEDMAPQIIAFSIKNGANRCVRRATIDITVRGLSASCGAPRLNPFNGFAGCAGNDDVDNECLWNITVPRPGGVGWVGEVCVTPPPPLPPSPRPPRPAAKPSKGNPPVPPSPGPPNPPKPVAKPGGRSPGLLLPPPPPPPSSHRIPFPFCACKKRSPRNTPYRLIYRNSTKLVTLSDGVDRQRHCFSVEVTPCDATTTCCGMGIKKIELFAKNECRKSVRLVLVDGMSVSWSFTQDVFQSATYTTFKLPTLTMSRQEVGAGFDVCLQAIEPCARLEDFCWGDSGSCRATFFSLDEQCCPTSDAVFGAPPSSSPEPDPAGAPPPVVEVDVGRRLRRA